MKPPYYPDLSQYQNALTGIKGQVFEDVKNIGWLDDEHEYPVCKIKPQLLEKLKELVFRHETGSVNVGRGSIDDCPICGEWPVYMSYTPYPKPITLGISELWIPSSKGIIYACSKILYHYIDIHSYCPPDEFLIALSEFDISSDWDGRKELEKREDKHRKDKNRK